MFNERQKICIANVVLTFTENFMENGDTIFLAIVQKIFRDNLQIPFNEASLRSIPKINFQKQSRIAQRKAYNIDLQPIVH